MAAEQTGDPVVIVAAHNEADRIEATLEALAGAFPSAQIMVADDASGDRTAELALKHGAQVVGRRRSLGKGANVTAAVQAALDRADEADPPTFLLCDADLGPSAGELPGLVRAVARGECDLAVGAFRDRAGGGFGLARSFARWTIERRCGYRAEAPISGQRALAAKVLPAVLPFARGWGMETAMTIDAVRAGFRVREIELDLEPRPTGRNVAGFLHRARQLRDVGRAYASRRVA